jgi:hypothetical protein
MATITFTNQTVQNFVTDLDENIVYKELHAGVDGFGVTYGDIHIDFVNPVTGSVDQVQFGLCDHYETLRRISYVIDSSEGTPEELEIADLDELYDFILIDEEQ